VTCSTRVRTTTRSRPTPALVLGLLVRASLSERKPDDDRG